MAKVQNLVCKAEGELKMCNLVGTKVVFESRVASVYRYFGVN